MKATKPYVFLTSLVVLHDMQLPTQFSLDDSIFYFNKFSVFEDVKITLMKL